MKPYTLPNHKKVVAPKMVYISGEEMTHYTMNLILDQWIKPHVEISSWQFFDMSCKSRDDTDDKVLYSVFDVYTYTRIHTCILLFPLSNTPFLTFPPPIPIPTLTTVFPYIHVYTCISGIDGLS